MSTRRKTRIAFGIVALAAVASAGLGVRRATGTEASGEQARTATNTTAAPAAPTDAPTPAAPGPGRDAGRLDGLAGQCGGGVGAHVDAAGEADGTVDDAGAGGHHGVGLLPAQHGLGDLRRVGQMADAHLDDLHSRDGDAFGHFRREFTSDDVRRAT